MQQQKRKKRYQQKSIINSIIASQHVAKTKDPSPMSSLLISQPDANFMQLARGMNLVFYISKSTNLNGKIVTEFILVKQFKSCSISYWKKCLIFCRFIFIILHRFSLSIFPRTFIDILNIPLIFPLFSVCLGLQFLFFIFIKFYYLKSSYFFGLGKVLIRYSPIFFLKKKRLRRMSSVKNMQN